MLIRIFSLIWGLIVNIIFDITREKLIDENKKYDFLINKFKHLTEEVPGRGPLYDLIAHVKSAFKKEYKVESIEVGLPKKTTEDWKVFAIMKKTIEEHQKKPDPTMGGYQLMETLPMTPGAEFDVDAWRRRLLAYLTDAKAIRERFAGEAGGPPPYWLIILDDVHHVAEEARDLLGALLDISKKSPLRLLFISRTTLNVYDRRDVHTREIVEELPLKGLSVEEISSWVENMDGAPPTPEEVHKMTGGHPLALELLEIYGQATHGDWLKFLDEEIITQMPDVEHELLATLAVADSPVPWSKLSSATGWDGKPPERLLSYGLLLELEDGMWLHEALRERFLREVGENSAKRKKSLN